MGAVDTSGRFGRSEGVHLAEPVEAPRFRLKRWHFVSVDTPDHFVGVGLVHLGYLAQVFFYVVDKTSRQRLCYERVSGLGTGLRMMGAPDTGSTHWRGRDARVSLQATDTGWQLAMDVPLQRRFCRTRMRGELQIPRGRGVSLHFDLGNGRRAYTYKVADVTPRGVLQLADRELPLQSARAAMDWTRSHALRHTRWRWASACGVSETGQHLGLNLSQLVYDLKGVSQENTLWVDGAPQALGRVELSTHEVAGTEGWILRGDEVALRFVPDGARTDARNLGLLRSHFVQASGHFTGNLHGLRVARMYGLMEDHDALW